jgi:hypothetical protein
MTYPYVHFQMESWTESADGIEFSGRLFFTETKAWRVFDGSD